MLSSAQVFYITFVGFIGTKGRNKGEFTNLQGVAACSTGKILIADSNNQCVQVRKLCRHNSNMETPGTVQYIFIQITELNSLLIRYFQIRESFKAGSGYVAGHQGNCSGPLE